MNRYETNEIWLSDNCSLAILRLRDIAFDTEQVFMMQIPLHRVDRLQLRHTHAQAGAQPRQPRDPAARFEIYEHDAYTVVLDQQKRSMRFKMWSGVNDRRSLHLTRIRPTGHAAQQILRLLRCFAPELDIQAFDAMCFGHEGPRTHA